MRIGVVSDSHGDLYMLDRAIQRMGEIEAVIHLGDHYRDILKVNDKYKLQMFYVPGNNDYFSEGQGDSVIEIGGKRIFMTHGHKYSIYINLMTLMYKAEEERADIVLYGHTHRYSLENQGNIFFLNPGSVSRPRDHVPSAAVLTITEGGDVYAEKVSLQA